jgi:hypothetical protein
VEEDRLMADVEVIGLRELTTALRQVDKALAKDLRGAFKAIADHVVGVAQQRMPFGSGTAAKSLKPRSTDRGATINFPRGGPGSRDDKAAYYPWLDFGGSVGRGRKPGVAWSGSITRDAIPGGRYLYPAIGESREYIATEVDKAIGEIARKAGFT